MPRWWLWLFYATVIWSVGYWVGLSGLAAYLVLQQRPVQLAHAQRRRDPTRRASTAARPDDDTACFGFASRRSSSIPELLDFARALGKRVFADNCAPCHGVGGGGARGYPNLTDDDWLWGGKLADISQTITHGIRSGDDEGRQGSMPAFGRDGNAQAR